VCPEERRTVHESSGFGDGTNRRSMSIDALPTSTAEALSEALRKSAADTLMILVNTSEWGGLQSNVHWMIRQHRLCSRNARRTSVTGSVSWPARPFVPPAHEERFATGSEPTTSCAEDAKRSSSRPTFGPKLNFAS
jgi:hypothetical protein